MPFLLYISAADYLKVLLEDCIQVFKVSKGCSKGNEANPQIIPSAETYVSLMVYAKFALGIFCSYFRILTQLNY